MKRLCHLNIIIIHLKTKLCIDDVTSENTWSSIARCVLALLGCSSKIKQEIFVKRLCPMNIIIMHLRTETLHR